MSSIRITPTYWFCNSDENRICLYGKLSNSKTVYAEMIYQNYLTIDTANGTTNDIDTDYLQNNLPICKIEKNLSNVKLYFQNKYYFEFVLKYLQERKYKIVNDKQDVLNKFFIDYRVSPGSVQEIFNLQHCSERSEQNERYDFYYSFSHIESVFDNSKFMNLSYFGSSINSSPSILTKLFIRFNTESISTLTVYPNNYIKNTIILQTSGLEEKNITMINNIVVKKVKTNPEMFLELKILLASIKPDMIIHYSNAIQVNAFQENIFEKMSYNIINLKTLYEKEFIYIPVIAQTLESIEKYVLGTDYSRLDVDNFSDKLISNIHSQTYMLYLLWKENNVENSISMLENFWKSTINNILHTSDEKLFLDLLFYFNLSPIVCSSETNKLFEFPRKRGLYTNCAVYSLSNLYLDALTVSSASNTTTALAYSNVSEYFKFSNKGALPYIYLTSNSLNANSLNTLPQHAMPSTENILWSDGIRLWLTSDLVFNTKLKKLNVMKVFMSANDSCLELYNDTLLDIGNKSLIKQPFPLILKYILHILSSLINSPYDPIIFNDMNEHFSDFELEMRIYSTDMDVIDINFDSNSLVSASGPSAPGTSTSNNIRKIIIDQLKHMKIRFKTDYVDVKYIVTINGPVISKIYLNDIARYFSKINFEYYNATLRKIISELIN